MRRTLVLLAVMCLGQVLLISAQVQSRSGLPVLEAGAFGAYARIQAFSAATADTVHNLWTNYFALRGAARENAALRERILYLEGQNQQQQAALGQVHSLEEALKLRDAGTFSMLAARVIAGNPTPGSLTVTIDRGSDDGVDVDMAVISAQGVVGRVIAPLAPRAALVQLLIGRNAAAGVIFEKSQTGGLVTGGAVDPPLRAEYVPASATIPVGEKVFTSGQDGIYPIGYRVGTVERVRGEDGPDREIAVRPAVDFSHIDIVLVVLSRPPRPPGGEK